MKITQTIELSPDDKEAIERTLKILDEISKITGGFIDEIITYFEQNANINGDEFSINSVHQISDIVSDIR